MVTQMTKWERIDALRRGEPTDHSAWSLWRHFYDRESTAEDLANAMVTWQRTYDFDFLKVNPRAQYHVEPWGVAYRYPQGGGRPERVTSAEDSARDWLRVEPRPPTKGVLGEQLQAIRRIRAELGPAIPMIETVFTPLSVLADLVDSEDRLVRDLRTAPERVASALEAVTETFVQFVGQCLDAGADGIFLATTQMARHDVMTHDEYARFGRPFDLRVLRAAEAARFNVLHVCGDNGMVVDLADYPIAAVNWAVTSPTTPSLDEASTRVPAVLIGGLSNEALTASTPDRAIEEAAAGHRATGGRRWALGANCTIPPTSREATLLALKETVTHGRS
ncbi:MAG: hypothetical protein GEU73_02600 [Chloroflexi bacterium]|nr:hypothetical protein [Chloroflexota bacterium]